MHLFCTLFVNVCLTSSINIYIPLRKGSWFISSFILYNVNYSNFQLVGQKDQTVDNILSSLHLQLLPLVTTLCPFLSSTFSSYLYFSFSSFYAGLTGLEEYQLQLRTIRNERDLSAHTSGKSSDFSFDLVGHWHDH